MVQYAVHPNYTGPAPATRATTSQPENKHLQEPSRPQTRRLPKRNHSTKSYMEVAVFYSSFASLAGAAAVRLDLKENCGVAELQR